MRFLFLALLMFLRSSVDSMPQNMADESNALPFSDSANPELNEITNFDIAPFNDSADDERTDIAGNNIPTESDGQSSSITSLTDGSGSPISISGPDVSKPEDSYLLASTDSVASDGRNPGLLIASSSKTDKLKHAILGDDKPFRPDFLSDNDDMIPSCTDRRVFHCCFVSHGRLICIEIKHSHQYCNEYSSFLMCCGGIKHGTNLKKNPKFGQGSRCKSANWTPKPTFADKARGFVWDKTQGAINFIGEGVGRLIRGVKEIQSKNGPGSDLIQPNNLPDNWPQ